MQWYLTLLNNAMVNILCHGIYSISKNKQPISHETYDFGWVRLKPRSLAPQSVLKRLPHSTYRSKRPALCKYMGTHLDSTLSLNGNFNSKYKKFSSRLQLLSKLCPNLNVKAARMIYTNIVISFFTYCGTVNLKSCWYHHQDQYSEVNTNKDLCETSCLPNCQHIYNKAATSNYE